MIAESGRTIMYGRRYLRAGTKVGSLWRLIAIGAGVASMVLSPAANAQIRNVDPNTSIDADLAPAPSTQNSDTPPLDVNDPPQDQTPANRAPPPPPVITENGAPATATGAPVTPNSPPAAPLPTASYQKDDLIGAAEGVFGKGAAGLAGIIEKILKDQGQPNAYIAGREASGAFVVGLRYGSGTLNHKVEGTRDVYWTGPSVGFDVGGNAGNTFVLVYNLYDTQDLYHRFPAGEGGAYFVGGFTASYLRWGKVVLIPIRLGVGYRLGVNAGYMKFTEKRNWLPF
ncbi:EipA family protein [Sphingobium sp. SCG-1]|uniref:EipA family protein n=1 Tax=Sphingobium sp. SCG-1 TaxID=2072936 RepID=UPI0039830A20